MPSVPNTLLGRPHKSTITSRGRLIYTYSISGSDNTQWGLCCWDTETETEIWKSGPFTTLFPEALLLDEAANGKAGAVYTGDSRGTIQSLRLDNGQVSWSMSAKVQLGNDCLTIYDGKLYCVSGLHVVYAIDPTSGSILWQTDCIGTQDQHIPLAFPMGITIDSQTGTLACVLAGPYHGSHDPDSMDITSIFAVSLSTHKLLWNWDSEPRKLNSRRELSVAGGCGRFFYASQDGVLRALNATTGAIDESWTFQILGRPATGLIFSPPKNSAGKSILYVATERNVLFAVEAETHQEAWRCQFDKVPQPRASDFGPQKLVLSPLDGKLYLYRDVTYYLNGNPHHKTYACCVDPWGEGASYALRSFVDVESSKASIGIPMAPAVCDGKVYVCADYYEKNAGQYTFSPRLLSADLSWARRLTTVARKQAGADDPHATTLRITGRDNQPAPNAPVDIWGPDAVVVKHAGTQHSLAAGQKLRLTTNSSGELAFSAAATVMVATPDMTDDAASVVPFHAPLAAQRSEDSEEVEEIAPPGKSIQQVMIAHQLMVGTYTKGAGDSIQPRDASYQTYIRLLDERGNPRANYEAMFSAADQCLISCNGRDYKIGPEQTATVHTDSSGNLQLVARGDNQITLPTIMLQCEFLGDGGIGIHHDHKAVNRVATMKGGELDPNKAKSYDGTPLLKPDYRSDENRTAVAKMMQNTMGGQAKFLAPHLREPNQFLHSTHEAYFMRVASFENDPPRGWRPGPDGSFKFKIQPGGCTFTPLTAAEAALAIEQGRNANNIFDDIADFFRNIVNGVEKVVQVVVRAVETAAEFVIDGVSHVYHFVVNTVEEAATVVAGVVKTIADAVERFVEFLSWLFDWNAYVELAGKIRDRCSRNLKDFQNWWKVNNPSPTVDNFFAGMEKSVRSLVASATGSLGAQTVKDGNSEYNDPQAQFSTGGANSYAQTRWLADKVQSSNAVLLLASAENDAFNKLTGAFESLWTSAEVVLKQAVPDLAQQVQDAFGRLSQRFKDPAGFAAQALAEFLSLIGEVVITLMKAAHAVASAFLKAVGDLLDAVWAILHLEVDIPVITWIYEKIAGSTLKIIDVFSLLVAIPTRIIGAVVSSSVDTMKLAYSLSLTVQTMFDFGAVVAESSSKIFLSGVVALRGITQLLGMPMRNFPGTPAPAWQEYVLWALSNVPLIGASLDYAVAKGHQHKFLQKFWIPYHDEFYCGYGLGMLTTFSVYAATWNRHLGNNGVVLIQNLFGVIAFPFRPLSRSVPGRAVLAAITVIGGGVNAGMSYQYLTAPAVAAIA